MRLFCFVLVLCGHAASAFAQLPSARLFTIFPAGGQQGTSVDVTLGGADLDDLTSLYISHPSLKAKPKLDAAGKSVPNTFTIEIGRETPPGSYDVRAVGRFGVSNPRAFVVDRDPQSAVAAGNVSRETAAPLVINAGVYSVAVANGRQYFRIDLKSGQRAFIDIDVDAIDSRLQPVVVLHDPMGREVAQDARDGSIDFTAPADGAYVAEVHDVLYRGGPEYFYRIRASTGPRFDFLVPPVLSSNGLVEMSVFGRNIPGASGTPPHIKLNAIDADDAEPSSLRTRWQVKPPAATLDGVQRYMFGNSVSPLFLARPVAPLVAEAAGNDEPTKAQKLTPPFELYGQFFPRSDQDWVAFDAKKGEAFWIEVVSNRLLEFTDPIVIVQRVAGDKVVDVKEAYEPENISGLPRHFYAAHRDPAFRFAAPEDGSYRLLVRDLFNEGADDPRRVYRLSVAPAASREDFRLIAWPMAQPVSAPPTTWGANVRPGGVLSVSMLAIRTGGFAGDITLAAENLPPGVTCPPVVMNGGTNAAELMIAADEKAAPFVGSIRIVGTAKSSVGSLSRVARAGTVVWTLANAELDAPRSRVAEEFVMSVSAGEPEAIAVKATEEKVWEESVAGRIEIPLKITRRGVYSGTAVKLRPLGAFPKIIAYPEFEIPAAASDGKLVLDIGALELPPGNHSIYLQATSTAAYDRFPAQFAAAQTAKAAADKATPELAAAVTKATEAVNAAKAVANNATNLAATEKALAEANEKVKQNEAAKAALVEQIKALSPKPTAAYAFSPAIALKIGSSPITLAALAPVAIKVGAKTDVPVTITRLYNFADAVDLSAAVPQGVAGLSAANVAIPANATTGVIAIQGGADAKPGEYTLTLSASSKQNGRPIKVDQPIRVTVTAP